MLQLKFRYKVKVDDMDGACTTHGRDKKCVQNLDREI